MYRWTIEALNHLPVFIFLLSKQCNCVGFFFLPAPFQIKALWFPLVNQYKEKSQFMFNEAVHFSWQSLPRLPFNYSGCGYLKLVSLSWSIQCHLYLVAFVNFFLVRVPFSILQIKMTAITETFRTECEMAVWIEFDQVLCCCPLFWTSLVAGLGARWEMGRGGETEDSFVQQNMSRIQWGQVEWKPQETLWILDVSEGEGGQNGGTSIIENVKCPPYQNR